MARTRTPPRPPARTEHPADAAVRAGSGGSLPEEQRAAFDAVLAAFRHYEAGDDDAARAALQEIGLQSPFLEWKVFLRGLLAYAAGDDARAVENWRRLDPTRLPARSAAPLRAALDPEYKAAQPPLAAGQLARRAESLAGGELPGLLRLIQAELGKDKPLAKVWKHAAAAAPLLRAAGPDLLPRLGQCLYHAIATQGEPGDLPKYKAIFGPPSDDPEFHKLEAAAHEEAGEIAFANARWAKYEAWLAGNPPGWPADLAARARAVVLLRMGRNAERLHAKAAGDRDDDLTSAVRSLFGEVESRRRTPPGPKPETFFARSRELAPDWAVPGRELFRLHLRADDTAAAERVAREVLKYHPSDLGFLESLANLVQRQGRGGDALVLWKQALAANPLDRRLQSMTTHAFHAAAREYLIAGRVNVALDVLDEGRTLCEREFPAGYFALRSVVHRKLGQTDLADAARDVALAVPGGRLAAALFLAVDSTLAKLKPAEKKAADQFFAAALAEVPTPLEINLLYGAWDSYPLAGITYRGQKTQEKKLFALIERCLTSPGDEADFENLVLGLVIREVWKLAETAAAACERRFPQNPAFKVYLAEALHARSPRLRAERQILRLLEQAQALPAGPRHAGLTARIDRLRQEYADPFEAFDFMFGRRR